LVVLCSGWLYARLGSHAFWVMSVLCLVALPVVAKLREGPRAEEGVV